VAAARERLDRRRARVARRPTRGLRRRGIVPLLALGLGVLVACWFLVSLLQPFGGDSKGSVEVAVPAGASVAEIGDLLERKGVVSSAFFFRVRATLGGGADLKAGRFELREGMSYAAAIDALSVAPPTETFRVAIPEGRARREVKQLVENTRLQGDYLALTKRSPIIDPREYGVRRARDLEGFLFPATYELGPGSGARELVRQQLRTFKREVADIDMSFARSRNLTRYDVLVIASMVEREAQVPRERPIIASVIYNRLRKGIPLGIDATVRFATSNWTEPLSDPELGVDSPYNTRERQGLPPGPIGSPGLASIKAAARPARTGFIFFVVKPGTCGEHDFSKTNAEFLADEARYKRERARRGGKSPTDC